MTVRVNKPEFNLREKLSELERPIGLKGSELMRAETTQEARDFISAGRKNMIINGQMSINQRNGTSSYTIPNATGGSYGAQDRWAINEATDGSVSVNMDGDPRSGNADGSDVQEFAKAMQIACQGTDTSLASTQNLHFFQNIEGYNIIPLAWGTPGAKPATLSFWVRSNVVGTYCVGLENSSTNRCCIKEYEVKPGFGWQKVSLTFPGCTDGSWEQDEGCGIRVRFCLASGTQYDDGIDGQWVSSDVLTTGNQVNFMTSTSNRFFITGVQLEVGSTATEFEHRSYGEELALCQRYYQKITNSDTGTGRTFVMGGYNSTRSFGGFPLSTPMRSEPAVTINSLGLELLNLSNSFVVTDALIYQHLAGSNAQAMEFKAASGITGTTSYYVSFFGNGSYLAFDAEL